MAMENVAKILVLGSSLTLAMPMAVGAQDSVEEFYRGNTVTIVVGSAAGTGYDTIARAVARYIGEYIPGNPSIIVQNMPGAGSVSMTNQLYHSPTQDGTMIGAAINGMPTAPLLQPDAAQFDPMELNWIGSTSQEIQTAIVWHTSPVQSLEELRTQELTVGSTGLGTATSDFPTLSNNILGLNFDLVRGYAGTAEINLAMASGEVDGNGGIGWSSVKTQSSDWLADGSITVIAQYGLEPHPDLPDVPLVFDLAETEEDRQALRLVFARQEYGRPYFVGPGVPEERVEALRRAFDATMEDPDFLADAERLQIDIAPMAGEDLAELISSVLETPTEVVERVRVSLQ